MSNQPKWNWIKKSEFVSHIQAQGWNVEEVQSQYDFNYDGFTYFKAWKNNVTSHHFSVSKSGYVGFIWTISNKSSVHTSGDRQLEKVLKQMNISME